MHSFWLVFLSLIIGGVIFWTSEYIRRKFGYSNEVSRKSFHIISGLLAIIWAFVVGYKVLIVVEIIFILLALATRKLGLFKWLFQVGRKTWGEIFFAIAIIGAALVAPSKLIYTAAILEIAIADAVAALIGGRFGRRNSYKIMNSRKSIAGSLAFFVVSLLIVGWVILYSGAGFAKTAWPVILWLPLLTTFLENISPLGIDNLLVPLLVLGVLGLLQFIY